MKKGHDVKEMLNNINEDKNNKKDYLVDMKSIKVETNNLVYPSISVDHGENKHLLRDREFVLTDHSLNQLCG